MGKCLSSFAFAFVFICTAALGNRAWGTLSLQGDTFDGDLLDPHQWMTRKTSNSSVSQQDALRFDVPSRGDADATSRYIQLPIGGSARVDLIPHALPSGLNFGKAVFFLTTATGGPDGGLFASDSHKFGFEISFTPSTIDFSSSVLWWPPSPSGQIGSAQGFYTHTGAILDHRFTIEIQRRTATVADYFVYDEFGTLLRATNWNAFSPQYRDDLFIALAGHGVLSFDNLVLTRAFAIPEPSGLLSLSAAGLLLRRCRRNPMMKPDKDAV